MSSKYVIVMSSRISLIALVIMFTTKTNWIKKSKRTSDPVKKSIRYAESYFLSAILVYVQFVVNAFNI